MLGAFALVDGFGVGLGRTAVRLETTEFAHGAGRRTHPGGGLVAAFQLHGERHVGVAGEEDGVPLEFDGDDELLLRAGFTRSDLRPARSARLEARPASALSLGWRAATRVMMALLRRASASGDGSGGGGRTAATERMRWYWASAGRV